MQRRAFIKIITCSAFDKAFAARAQLSLLFVKGFGKLDLSTDKNAQDRVSLGGRPV